MRNHSIHRLTLFFASSTLILFNRPTFARDFGVDVSHNNGSATSPNAISQANWNNLAANKQFAYMKASEGLTGADDPSTATNFARATSAGILNGMYHYAHPENRPTTSGAIQEADHFISYAGNGISAGHLRPMLDLEGAADTLSVTDLSAWVLAFVNEVISIKGPGAEPIIYTNRNFAKNELNSTVHNLDLWIADYDDATTNPLPSAPAATTTYPDPTGVFDNWVIWQYSDSGTVGSLSPLDLDVVNSSVPLASLLIPEPGSLLLVMAGLAMTGLRRRR